MPSMGVLADRRILVVEDEALIALWIAEILRGAGATVIGPAGSAAEAVALVGRESIDGAVLDYKMPDGTTEPVADLLAARGVPFVFATGYYRGPFAPEHAGRPRLEKAFAEEELLAALATIFR
jgi:CheY-like chemotaxis protein